MDVTTLVILAALIVVSWVVLYFVIKAAVKNALHEDRVFQGTVEAERARLTASAPASPAPRSRG